MCFSIDNNTERGFAKEDITVYKVMIQPENRFLKLFLIKSLHVKAWYSRFGSPRSIKLKPDSYGDICKGYHSCATIEEAQNLANRSYRHKEAKIFEFVIPKGSEYYKYSNGYLRDVYVSSKIRIKDFKPFSV